MLVPIALALTSLVEGETCPAPADVEPRVRAILHLSDQQVLSERFIVERREAGLYVELRSAEDEVIGVRVVPSDGSCDELSQAAAVVLSAWLSDVHPDFAPGLPEPALVTPPEPAPPAPPKAPPPRAPVFFPQPKAGPPPPRPRSSLRLELDVGAGAGLSEGEWAFAGALGAAVVARSGFGVRGTWLLDTTREERLGIGSVDWRRWPASVGPMLRFQTASVAYDLALAPALVWLRVSGADFEPSRSQGGLTWAAVAEARVATRGPLGWFAALHGQAYLVDSSAYAGASEYVLPRFAATLLVGGRLSPSE